jgi:hypothetical protein
MVIVVVMMTQQMMWTIHSFSCTTLPTSAHLRCVPGIIQLAISISFALLAVVDVFIFIFQLLEMHVRCFVIIMLVMVPYQVITKNILFIGYTTIGSRSQPVSSHLQPSATATYHCYYELILLPFIAHQYQQTDKKERAYYFQPATISYTEKNKESASFRRLLVMRLAKLHASSASTWTTNKQAESIYKLRIVSCCQITTGNTFPDPKQQQQAHSPYWGT